MPHDAREADAWKYPVHITFKLVEDLPGLRTGETIVVLMDIFTRTQRREGFRLTEYSVQVDHIHCIVEAEDPDSYSRGIRSLAIRLAKGLNRFWGRKGKVLADRYHAHVLRTPREVRHALSYVLGNARKHGRSLASVVDFFSSAPWFTGWDREVRVRGIEGVVRPVGRARKWLLRVGWRKHGLIEVGVVPGGRRRRGARRRRLAI